MVMSPVPPGSTVPGAGTSTVRVSGASGPATVATATLRVTASVPWATVTAGVQTAPGTASAVAASPAVRVTLLLAVKSNNPQVYAVADVVHVAPVMPVSVTPAGSASRATVTVTS